jgi:hypothetical protein
MRHHSPRFSGNKKAQRPLADIVPVCARHGSGDNGREKQKTPP